MQRFSRIYVRTSLIWPIGVGGVSLKTRPLPRPFQVQCRAATFGAGMVLILLAAVAVAHGKLAGSTFSAGSSVSKLRTQLRLTFSEKIELRTFRSRT